MKIQKKDYFEKIGIIVILCSKLQNELQEGFNLFHNKLLQDNIKFPVKLNIRRKNLTLGAMLINFRKISALFIRQYGNKHRKLTLKILNIIKRKCRENIEFRNKLFHSVWIEKFWDEDEPEKYELKYQKELNADLDLIDLRPERLEEYIYEVGNTCNLIYYFYIGLHDGLFDSGKTLDKFFTITEQNQMEYKKESIQNLIHRFV